MEITLTQMASLLSVYSESVCAVVIDRGRFDSAAGYSWNNRSSIYQRRHVQNLAFYPQAIFLFSGSSPLDNERKRTAIFARGMWS